MKHAPQRLIIGKFISQYASYSTIFFCLLHSNIGKEQHEKHLCNPPSHYGKYGEHIGSFYCPPNSPSTIFDKLAQNLDDIKEKYPHSKIIIAGDFNCPGIDWEHGLLLTDTYTSRTLREKLPSVSQDFQLSQIVTFPTRGMNTLDLCFTPHPDIILNCDSIPGFSDHDAILAIHTSNQSKYHAKYHCIEK